MCELKKDILEKPVLLLFGVEPYLVDYYKKAIEKSIEYPDLNIASYESFNEDAVAFLSEYPVLDDRRVVYLYTKALKDLSENALFMAYLKDPSEGTNLVVIPEKVDLRVKLVKQVEKAGGLLRCDKASKKQVDAVLFKEIRSAGVQIKEDAYNRFLELENYEELDEVTIYDLIHDLKNLCALAETNGGIVTVSLVESLLKQRVKEDVFSILKLIKARDIKALNGQRDVIQEPIGALSALLREYRIAFKAALGYKKEEIGARMISLQGESPESLRSGMEVLLSAINSIKSGAMTGADAFGYATKKLCL